MKRSIRYILIVTALSAGIIILLVSTATIPNAKKNGFTRTFLLIKPEQIAYREVTNIKDFCGSIGDSLYFSTSTPGTLMVTDRSLNYLKEIRLPLSDHEISKIKKKHSITIDSPYIYLFAGNVSAIFCYSSKSLQKRVYYVSIPFYTRIFNISDHSFILRGYNEQLKDQTLFKFNSRENELISEHSLSEIHKDGGVITAGHLNYDAYCGTFTYLNHYNNRFVVFDTNLQLITSGRTIDTFSRFQTATAAFNINGSKIRSYKKPPTIINQTTGLSNDKLFVCSNLKADNETRKDYWSNIPVDIYNLPDGSYWGSFYLPLSPGRELIKKMYVRDNEILTIYSNHISIFRIDFPNPDK